MYDPQQYNADHIVPQGTTGVSFFAVMKNVYLWMTLALAITGLTAMAVATQPQMVYSIASNSFVFWGLLLAELGLVWFISARIMSLSVTTAGVLFAIYALLNGVTFSFIFLVYTAASIAQTFFITAGVFAAMGLVGLFIKRDLSTFGRIFYMALIGLIIASVANWFFKNDMLMSICNYLGVIIFTGLTAYDTQKIKNLLLSVGGADNEMGLRIFRAFVPITARRVPPSEPSRADFFTPTSLNFSLHHATFRSSQPSCALRHPGHVAKERRTQSTRRRHHQSQRRRTGFQHPRSHQSRGQTSHRRQLVAL